MYRVITDPQAREQLAALPARLLGDYARVLDALEVAPWNGEPQHAHNPQGEVRRWLFGPGGAAQVIYLIVERDREVHVLRVLWADD